MNLEEDCEKEKAGDETAVVSQPLPSELMELYDVSTWSMRRKMTRQSPSGRSLPNQLLKMQLALLYAANTITDSAAVGRPLEPSCFLAGVRDKSVTMKIPSLRKHACRWLVTACRRNNPSIVGLNSNLFMNNLELCILLRCSFARQD
jgi:hypothetical protein